MKKILMLVMLAGIITPSPALGQETVTLTTYYPSPFGIYRNLTITDRIQIVGQPPAPPCTATDAGTVYVDSITTDLKYCDGTAWNEISGIWRQEGTPPLVFLRDLATVTGVGIGVSNPSVMLEVAQNETIKVGNAFLSSGGDAAGLATNEWFDGAAWVATGNGALIRINGQIINFHTHVAGVHTRRMTIDAIGNVRIGDAVPTGAARLEVDGRIILIGIDPLLDIVNANDAATKLYVDQNPVLQSLLLPPPAAATCPNSGTNGTRLRIRHAGCPTCWSAWVTTSLVYCNPI